MKNNALGLIGDQYKFVETTECSTKKAEDQITAYVKVKYHDEQMGIDMISEYTLELEKEDNWMIVSNG